MALRDLFCSRHTLSPGSGWGTGERPTSAGVPLWGEDVLRRCTPPAAGVYWDAARGKGLESEAAGGRHFLVNEFPRSDEETGQPSLSCGSFEMPYPCTSRFDDKT